MAHLRIQVSFIFDSKEIWANEDDFSRDLSDFLNSKGMEAEIIRNPLTDDEPNQLEIYVTKKESSISFLTTLSSKFRGKGLK